MDAASASTVGVEANKEAETAATLFRQIIESFTGPLDNLFKTADRVIKDLEGDDRIKDLFDEGHKFLDRAIHDPGYVTSSRASRRAEAIYDRAQDLIKSNAAWKADADAFVDAFNKALTKASNDRELTNLGNALDRFSLSSRKFGRRGLSLAEGKDVWGDLAQVFLPRLLGAVQSIPMPRVEFTVSLHLYFSSLRPDDFMSPFSLQTLTLRSTTFASPAPLSFQTALTSTQT